MFIDVPYVFLRLKKRRRKKTFEGCRIKIKILSSELLYKMYGISHLGLVCNRKIHIGLRLWEEATYL